ncbi:hypothetical protein [Urbifossiella limnaea]|uniref:EF-hand domain-containing protein n=1 Tax=Urbifossiella limnaea TaxID=2528023 RepID=A0A517XXR7_9BACT|nr:hypothetical protein [Urbifossiella limnaea]QDU22291.1 hypothetical protein ETAA1_42690 [Urbifossiella limnaea]
MRAPFTPALVLLVAAGCGGGSSPSISVPTYNPDGAAQDALKQFDKNGDGAIDGPELDAVPGLKAAFGGKKVTADALKTRIESYRAGNVGALGYRVKVTRNGAPLAGATVTFTPEPFLSSLREATATTDSGGEASNFTFGGDTVPGLPPGMYRVSVSKSGETIPAAFSTQTTVGCEVSGGRGGSGSLDVNIPGR